MKEEDKEVVSKEKKEETIEGEQGEAGSDCGMILKQKSLEKFRRGNGKEVEKREITRELTKSLATSEDLPWYVNPGTHSFLGKIEGKQIDIINMLFLLLKHRTSREIQ